MKLRIFALILFIITRCMHGVNFDYTMAHSIDTLFKREITVLNSQEALAKLTQVALTFWNNNTPALLNFTKSETCSIQTSLQALTFIKEAIDLGQALQKSEILQTFENQYLLAALVLDKITAMTHNSQDKIIQKKFNPETILILKAQLTNLLDSLGLITNKLQYSYLETATHIVLQISQPQLTYNKILYPALEKIQTIDMYTSNKIVKNNLKNYKFIINSRNDGNSGYRTFFASICMHAIDTHQKEPLQHLEKLLHERFYDLFIKYDEFFPNNIKSHIGHALQKYLIEQLKTIHKYKNIEHLQHLYHEQILFDFYITKFLKYLIVDYGYKNEDTHSMILTMHKDFETYRKKIIPWGNNITDLEYTILAQATNITISIANTDNMHYTTTTHQAIPEYGTSYLIFTEQSHDYHILIPRKYQNSPHSKSYFSCSLSHNS